MEDKNYYMTDQEMTDFLESIGGLENGYYPDRGPIKSCSVLEIGNGWFGLVKELIEKCIELGWNKQTCQIKEKFGGLRFYINSASDEVFEAINEAEEKSYKVCEVTGDPGELRRDIGWYRTLSDEIYEQEKNKK
tara:strand:+ start:859 stop:1260 length:402 start_codon:yes stop_codon:yes gene_type:complete